MHSDGIRHGSTTAWRLWLGGVVTGAAGVLAFQGGGWLIGHLLLTATGVLDMLGSIPW